MLISRARRQVSAAAVCHILAGLLSAAAAAVVWGLYPNFVEAVSYIEATAVVVHFIGIFLTIGSWIDSFPRAGTNPGRDADGDDEGGGGQNVGDENEDEGEREGEGEGEGDELLPR